MSSTKDFIQHFDHTDPLLKEDPYPVFQELREKCPVAHSDAYGGFWVVTHYEDVFEAAHDFTTFSSASGVAAPPSIPFLRPMIPVEVDPPQHKKYRTILNPAFTPDAIAKLESYTRALVTDFIDAFIERGECDLAKDIAIPLPLTVITHMLGVPLEDRGKFKEWSTQLLLAASGGDPELGKQAMQNLYGYLGQVAPARRRQDPREDLIGLLLASEIDGARLTDEEVVDTCVLLLLAGNETTTNAIGNSLWRLAHHPEDRLRLIGNPLLIPTAVEEFVRYEAPVQFLKRTVTADIDFKGRQLRKGDTVLLLWASANRDEAEFPDAEKCLLDRQPNRHIGFGTGIHRCLGMHLARMELKVVLEEVLRRLPDYRIPEGAKVERHGGPARGFDSLPVVFTPGPQSSTSQR